MPKRQQVPQVAPEVKAWRDVIKPLKRLGISLYDQQLWCWGYDIRQQGNLLLRYGFAQYRQDKSCGGTAYTLYRPGESVLRLWGGNLLYHNGMHGTLHLKRYEFEPRLMPVHYELSYTTPEQGAFAQSAEECRRAAQLAEECMRWIAGYERWVIETAGLAHRQAAVQAWKQNAVFLIDAEQMAELWEDSADAMLAYVQWTP